MKMDGSVTEWVTLALAVVTGVGVPLILFFMARASADRQLKFNEVHLRLNHFDECIDTLQKVVLGKAATREDMLALKAEVNEIINRQRLAISQEVNAIHQRVMRLENKALGVRDGC
jgi:hypothetical protein